MRQWDYHCGSGYTACLMFNAEISLPDWGIKQGYIALEDVPTVLQSIRSPTYSGEGRKQQAYASLEEQLAGHTLPQLVA